MSSIVEPCNETGSPSVSRTEDNSSNSEGPLLKRSVGRGNATGSPRVAIGAKKVPAPQEQQRRRRRRQPRGSSASPARPIVTEDASANEKRKKRYCLWGLTSLLGIVGLCNLVLSVTIITVLRVSRGMEAMEVIPEARLVKFYGQTDLDEVRVHENICQGYGDEPVELVGDASSVLLAVKNHRTPDETRGNFRLFENGSGFSLVESFQVRDSRTGDTLFSTNFPNFGLPRGVGKLAVNLAETHRIVSPVNSSLSLESNRRVSIHGAESTSMDGKAIVWTADNDVFVRSNRSVILNGKRGIYLDVGRMSLAPSRERTNDQQKYLQYKICVCMPQGKLFRVPVPSGSHLRVNCARILAASTSSSSEHDPLSTRDEDRGTNVSIAESAVEKAVDATGFGTFNYKIMGVCGLIYFNYGFGIGSLSIVAPTAACDFEMTTIDKSRLSVAAALGMLCGAYRWGCVADVKGRKFALVVSLLLHGGFDAVSAVVSNYRLFVSTKFFSGLGTSGELALIFTYLGEFQPSNVRDRILTWMELAWALGFTVVPGIAWVIIPLDIGYRTSYFFFNSWNLFTLICSIPALLIAVRLLLLLPETPEYLAESGQYAQLLRVLERMYSENTGNPAEEYSTEIGKMGEPALEELTRAASRAGSTTGTGKSARSVGEKMASFLKQTVMIFKPPYLRRTLIIGTVMICPMSSYFSLVLWLPEVFNRFATFEDLYPSEAADICTVTERLRSNLTKSGSREESLACETSIKTDVYRHSIILGVTSVPTAIWLPLFVERLGYVFHLVLGSFICAAVTCGLLFVSTSAENLALACIFDAVASIRITVVLCTLVELYPTHLRVAAAAFSTFVGRVGSFLGNGLFGYLIDDYRVPLVSIIAGQLFLSGILCAFVPLRAKRPRRP